MRKTPELLLNLDAVDGFPFMAHLLDQLVFDAVNLFKELDLGHCPLNFAVGCSLDPFSLDLQLICPITLGLSKQASKVLSQNRPRFELELAGGIVTFEYLVFVSLQLRIHQQMQVRIDALLRLARQRLVVNHLRLDVFQDYLFWRWHDFESVVLLWHGFLQQLLKP